MVAYKFNPKTKQYIGTIERQEDLMNPGTYLMPANCTDVEPPECDTPYVPVWDGTKWLQVEDHRRHLDNTGHYIGGTAYWLPAEGDDWQSEPRYMVELGSLPEGAVTSRPAKPQAEIDKETMQGQIAEAKAYLDSTDYAVIKCAEQGLSLDETYPGLKETRQEKRDLINQLEAQAQAQGISLA